MPTPINPKTVTNPELVQALAKLHQENTPQNQGVVLAYTVEKASFLAPVIVAGPNSQHPVGPVNLKGKNPVQFRLIAAKDGRTFLPAFTDLDELRKFTGENPQQVLILRFDNYASMLAQGGQAAGLVINPMGVSLTLDRDTVAKLAQRKKEIARGYGREQVEKDTQVMVGDPEEEPTELLQAVCQAAASMEEVKHLWLRLFIRQDNDHRYMIVVDHTGIQEEVFHAIAQAAAPYATQRPVDMVPYGTPFAQAATQDVEPFYQA